MWNFFFILSTPFKIIAVGDPYRHLLSWLWGYSRLFQNYVSNTDAESLSSMGLDGMSPEIINTATEMIRSMKPEELQKMLEVASSLKGNGPPFPDMNGQGLTPELIRMASDKISSMPPEELKKMYEVSSSFNPSGVKAASDFSFQQSESSSQSSARAVDITAGTRSTGEQSSSTTLSKPPSDLQEAMRNSMNNPAMRQVRRFDFRRSSRPRISWFLRLWFTCRCSHLWWRTWARRWWLVWVNSLVWSSPKRMQQKLKKPWLHYHQRTWIEWYESFYHLSVFAKVSC